MTNPQAGILNYFIQLLGMKPIAFLSNQDLAKYSISLANIWRGTAPTMILMYAGLKTVPTDLLEAARGGRCRGLAASDPHHRSLGQAVILTNLLLNTINTFNTFDMIMSLTGGGPGRSTEVLVLNAYNRIFSQLQLGARRRGGRHPAADQYDHVLCVYPAGHPKGGLRMSVSRYRMLHRSPHTSCLH